MKSPKTHYRTCPLCEAACGLKLEVLGDRVSAIRGDPEDVLSRGYICPKGSALGEIHDDPDRLRAPLVKRDGEHVEVAWDEAFEEIERRLLPLLEEFGRNAAAIYLGNPNVHNLAGSLYLRPVIKAAGTRNLFSASTVDQMPRHVSSGLLFGSPDTIPVPDLDRCDYLLILGANPVESNGSLCTAPDFPGRLKAIGKRGGRVVVIDPRRTRTTRIADEHIFIRPGGDAFLLIAMIQVLFAEERVDLGRIEEHVNGLETIRSVSQSFTPERVAQHCGVEAETIRRLARELSRAGAGAVYGRIGVHTTAFGTFISWASDILNILTGNLDRPGGSMFPRPAHARIQRKPGGRGFSTGRWRSRVRELPEVRGEFPVATMIDEMEKPGQDQVRALITIAGNPVLSTPNSARLQAAIENLDFMLSVDLYCNETTRHADVILPPPSPLERCHYDIGFSSLAVHNYARYSPATFETDRPSEARILARLALLLGGQGAGADPASLDEMLLRGSVEGHISNPYSPLHGREIQDILSQLEGRSGPEALLDIMLRTGHRGDAFGAREGGLSLSMLEDHPHGVDLGALESRIPEILSTPSAEIELAAPEILGEFDRLDAELSQRPGEGLLLIGRRHLRSNNSWLHNIPSLVSGRERCTLQMHPDDARQRGVEEAASVEIRSAVGSVHAPLELSEDLMPGVVSLPHGWGHGSPGARLSVAAAHPGVNSNCLSDGGPLDPLSGNAILNGIPVEVKAI